jgi:hypothetical protein
MRETKGTFLLPLLFALVFLPFCASVLLARGIPAILRQPTRARSLILNPPHHWTHLQVLWDSFTHRHMPMYQVHLDLKLRELSESDAESIGMKWQNTLPGEVEQEKVP